MNYNPNCCIRCIKCDEPMLGIRHPDARDTCEPCGGNTTEFHKGNPWRPEETKLNKYDGFKI